MYDGKMDLGRSRRDSLDNEEFNDMSGGKKANGMTLKICLDQFCFCTLFTFKYC